jgi:hypothetical protein
MCEHGDTVPVEVKVVAGVSHSGRDEWKVKPIDRCLSDLVRALQDGGIDMLGSCCGHGERQAQIVLADGRRLFVCRDAAADSTEEEERP